MPTYYVFGKDDLLIREELKLRLGRDSFTHLYGDEMKLADLLELMTSSDLFAVEEAYWIEGIKGIKVTKGKECDTLDDALKTCPPNKLVAFSQNLSDFKDYRASRDFEVRNALHNLLKNATNEFYDLSQMSYPDRVIEWAVARAKKYGLALNTSAAVAISEACANLPQLIDGELQKLAVLKTSDKLQPVSEKMIRENVFEVPSEKIFAYLDALLERKNRAVYLLEQLFDFGAEGTAILGAIYRRFELVIRAIADGVRSLDEVKRMPYDARQRFAVQVRSWDRERISRAFELIAEADFGLKTSRAGQYDLLAVLTVEVMEL